MQQMAMLKNSKLEGIDEICSLVTRYTSIRIIISLAAFFGWKLHQMNVKTAFLNGEVEQEIYIEQPRGFAIHGKESHVFKLKKALYGLKQAPRASMEELTVFFRVLGSPRV
jgi:hypothetical protein